jgi:hypothetical protein
VCESPLRSESQRALGSTPPKRLTLTAAQPLTTRLAKTKLIAKRAAVSGNPMTTDRATLNRQKNDPKCQPYKMAHLVLPDTQADPSQNQMSHFFANALTSFRH